MKNRLGRFFLVLIAITLFPIGCLTQKNGDVNADPCVCRFVPERMDDFSWENDLTAWRAYGPALLESPENSGIDIWLKAVDYPIMEKLYKAATRGRSYHQFRGEAYDPYHVGKSLGCGGTALTDGKGIFLSNVYRRYEILQEQGDFIKFRLFYLYEGILGSQFEEIRTITLAKGDFLQRVEVEVRRISGDVVLFPVIGLTLHDGAAVIENDQLPAPLTTTEFFGKDFMATALIPLGDQWMVKVVESSTPDESHLLVVGDVPVSNEGLSYSYLSGYGWSGQKKAPIMNIEEWNLAIQNELGEEKK